MNGCHRTLIALAVALLSLGDLLAQTPVLGPREASPDSALDGSPVKNAGFEDGAVGTAPPGWKARSAPGYEVVISKDDAAAGEQCATIRLQPNQSPGFSNLLQRVDPKAFLGKRVRLRAAIRTDIATPDHTAQMWFRVDRRDKDGTRRLGAFDNMANRPITTNQWQYYDIVGDVDTDATDITFGLFLRGAGQVWFDDVSLQRVGDDVAVTTRPGGGRMGTPVGEIKPGLFEVVSSTRLTPYATPWSIVSGIFGKRDPESTHTMLLPLPLAYRDQVPINFQLSIDPPEAAHAIDIYADQGDNYVLKLTVDDVRKWQRVDVTFKSLVLVGPSDFAAVPATAPVPDEWPDEARPWLAATWCADASHPGIQSLAKKIRGETDDVRQIIKQVEKQASSIYGSARGQVLNLTAVEALDKQGSCTSCANLVAALLRACDVPARILAGYPSWSGPLQTHYIVEAYVPDFGWYPVESTRCESPWPNTHQVNVAIIPPEYEAESKAGTRFGIAGGVPYLSLTESPDNASSVLKTGMVEEARSCDHECRMIRALSGSADEWHQVIEGARVRWQQWLAAEHELDAKGQLRFGRGADAIAASELRDLAQELERTTGPSNAEH